MPTLYLCQWKDGNVTLCSATDLKDLYLQMEDIGDTFGCTFKEYTGPLRITFKPITQVEKCREPEFHMPPKPTLEQDLVSDIKGLLKNDAFSDVELLVEGRSIRCHKAILAQRCEYFKAMFSSDMKEAASGQVEVNSFSYPVVKSVITFIYSGEVDISLAEGAHQEDSTIPVSSSDPQSSKSLWLRFMFLKDLHQAAEFYLMERLKEQCEWDILQLISEANKDDENTLLKVISEAVEFACESRPEILYNGLLREVLHLLQLWSRKEIFELPSQFQKDLKSYSSNILRGTPLYLGTEWELVVELMRPTKDITKLKQLVAEGASLEEVYALHLLCGEWEDVLEENDIPFDNKELLSIVEWILQEGLCRVNRPDHKGNVPLHYAAAALGYPLVAMLENAESCKNVKNKNLETPFEYMCNQVEEDIGWSMVHYQRNYRNVENAQKLEMYLKISEILEPSSSSTEKEFQPQGPDCTDEFLHSLFDSDNTLREVKVEFEWAKDHWYDGTSFEEAFTSLSYPTLQSKISSLREAKEGSGFKGTPEVLKDLKQAAQQDIANRKIGRTQKEYGIQKLVSCRTMRPNSAYCFFGLN